MPLTVRYKAIQNVCLHCAQGHKVEINRALAMQSAPALPLWTTIRRQSSLSSLHFPSPISSAIERTSTSHHSQSRPWTLTARTTALYAASDLAKLELTASQAGCCDNGVRARLHSHAVGDADPLVVLLRRLLWLRVRVLQRWTVDAARTDGSERQRSFIVQKLLYNPSHHLHSLT